MNTFNQAVIISASKKGLDFHENQQRHLKLVQYANQVLGCPIKALKGVYKGESEPSLYVEFKTEANLERLKDYAMAMEQESILYLDSNRIASLIYTDNTDKHEMLGKFTATDSKGIEGLDCYSYDAQLNQYYITKKVS